jgi:two-component system sensor kinase FixL
MSAKQCHHRKKINKPLADAATLPLPSEQITAERTSTCLQNPIRVADFFTGPFRVYGTGAAEAGISFRWPGIPYPVTSRDEGARGNTPPTPPAMFDGEVQMTLAAEAANLGYWSWDLTRNKIWASTNWRELFGFTNSKRLDLKQIFQRLHPEDREAVRQSFAKAIKYDGHYEIDFRLLFPDGQVRWIASRGRVQFASDGKPILMRGVSMDITDRKRGMDELRQSEELKKAIFDSGPARIAVLDPQGIIVAMNARWQQFALENSACAGLPPCNTGIGANYLEGCRQNSRKPTDTAMAAYNGIRGVIQSRLTNFAYEYACNSPQQQRWFSMSVTPIGLEERSAVVAHLDITDRKQAELDLHRHRQELAHVSRVSILGELSASMAHELNQPLTAILSNAQAAQRFLSAGQVDLGEFHAIIQEIVHDTTRARDVLHHLRSLVKKSEREFVLVDINEIINQVVGFLHGDIVNRNVTVAQEFTPTLPLVLGDRTQLQQVLLNLLLNAFDAVSGRCMPERRIMVLTAMESAEMIRVAVRDTGTGIPPEKLNQLFYPFFTTKAQGLGMGLSVSRSIIESHGGRLWAENNPDQGATFSFTLPVMEQK